jgi:diguanylate cyclase (GGDEF)-like protein/PAS domain S-box-containing protein
MVPGRRFGAMSSWRSTKLRDWLVSRLGSSRTAHGLKPPALKPASASPHALEIRAEQTRLLYDQLSSALIATLVVGGLVGYVLWDQVSRPWLVMWLVALGVTTAVRVWLLRSYVRTHPPASEAPRWAHRFIIGTTSAGVIWGLVGLFSFHTSSVVHEVFIAFVLAGLSAGGMTTLSSFRGAYLAFLAPAIAPYAIRLTLQKGEMYLAMGSMLFMFIAAMLIISVRHYRSVAASLRLRYDNIDLLADLATAAERQQAANQELEAKVQHRTKELGLANIVLEAEKELFRVTLTSIGDAVITTDATACVTFLNAVAERLTGWNDAEAKGQPLSEVFRLVDEKTHEPVEDSVARCLHGDECRAPEEHGLLICRDQREISVDTSVAPIRDNDNRTIGAVLVFRDVTAQRKLAHELSHQATHDTLTGLVNRPEFERRLTHLLASASPHNPHAFLYLDLDQFKVVNDTCGHIAGDDLLRQISALLRTKLRARDTLARLGGDEFGVLLDHCAVAEAKRVANSLREVLQGFRFGWQEKSFTIGVSIGLVPLVEAGETLTSVFSAADAACYAAKDMGRNRVHTYQANDLMLARRDGEMRWIPRIQQALADGRFRLYYQPIFAFSPGTIHTRHGEILLRMLDEQGRIVLPGAFIPAAERYGLMLAIDQWVVSRSLEALSAVAGDAGVFTINISGQSLGATEFLEFVTERIRDTGVAPDQLCFEITETAAASELGHVLRFIDTLKKVGCRFALDDFGTGLSSFSYLKTLPIDYLKIDGAFIRELASDDIDMAMVEAVNRIGHKMGLLTIAEGVESDAISQKLQEIGVDYGQGYGLGKPQPLNLQQALAPTRVLPRVVNTGRNL